jgi:radical SAM-linked protein
LKGVFALSDLRIKFVRGEEVKFISHLDLMKVFERASRRANIPIAFSQGFNPHAHLIFGLPLSVGVTSQSEYADIELTEVLEPESFVNKLNNELPKGLIVLDAKARQSKNNIMASIGAAAYEILISAPKEIEIKDFQDRIKEFLNEPEIVVKKESKKGIKELDIKPMIERLEIRNMNDDSSESEVNVFLQNYIKAQSEATLLPPSYDLGNIYCLSALLSAGSVANLKPELLFTAINGFMKESLKLVKIHRSGLFVNIGGALMDPLETSALS